LIWPIEYTIGASGTRITEPGINASRMWSQGDLALADLGQAYRYGTVGVVQVQVPHDVVEVEAV
jgi:hypothetical protein